MHQTCTKCQVAQPLDMYYKSSRNKQGIQYACKKCMNKAYTHSRNKKQQHYQEVSKTRIAQLVVKIADFKASKGCVNCGENNSCCIDFHHLNPNEKEFAISNMRGWSWDSVLLEIDKCVTLCRNCHAKVHAGVIVLQ